MNASSSPSAVTFSPNQALFELSERADGPALIAVRGSAEAGSEFELGTRETGWHQHLRGQVFCIENGLVHVRTPQGSWLLPPHRAGWVPPGVPHMASISGVMSGWNVLVTPQAARALPKEPCVVGVSEVLRALVRRAVDWSGQETLTPAQRRLSAVLLDELRTAPHEPLHLPMPKDRRLVRIAHAVLQAPGDTRTLDAWADWAGLSPRSLTRLCQAELGMPFAQWRQQAGLVFALEALARGEPVAQVSDALGYATPSNFIAMFRRAFGESPGRYFARRSSMADSA
jgi:AraC-like DNA-binding protein